VGLGLDSRPLECLGRAENVPTWHTLNQDLIDAVTELSYYRMFCNGGPGVHSIGSAAVAR